MYTRATRARDRTGTYRVLGTGRVSRGDVRRQRVRSAAASARSRRRGRPRASGCSCSGATGSIATGRRGWWRDGFRVSRRVGAGSARALGFVGRAARRRRLPDAEDLRRILSAAFFASLEREEGRPLRFVLCCAPAWTVVRDGFGETVSVVPLDVPRPLTVGSIRSLAPAVSPANAAMLVRFPRRAGGRTSRMRDRRRAARRRERRATRGAAARSTTGPRRTR